MDSSVVTFLLTAAFSRQELSDCPKKFPSINSNFFPQGHEFALHRRSFIQIMSFSKSNDWSHLYRFQGTRAGLSRNMITGMTTIDKSNEC